MSGAEWAECPSGAGWPRPRPGPRLDILDVAGLRLRTRLADTAPHARLPRRPPTRRAPGPRMRRPAAFEVLVVGGGVAGLAAAWQLARRGVERVALAERFRLGHDRGSSHGFTRITRSTYGDPVFVRLMQVAHGEDWPRLETDAGETLRHPVPGLFFGPPGGPFEQWAAAVAEVGADVERLDPHEARRRYPLFRFPGAEAVLEDHTSAVIAAAATIRALARRCVVEGVHVLQDTRVGSIAWDERPFRVETGRGTLFAERLVVAAGPWVRGLVPALAPVLTVRRQSVGFFALDAAPEAVRPGPFPVWVHLGPGANGIRYGLPEFGREGVKVGLHEVAGESQDPDAPSAPDEATLAEVRAFADELFSVRVRERLHAETCFYTSSASEDFVIDALPGRPGAVVLSACSGHGFKFGPLAGRLAAELVMDGRTQVAPFEAVRSRFAFPGR
jgi:sarcosine oxidase